MHQGHYVFAQLMQHLPLTTFRRCVARYNGEYRIQQFSCLDQYLCLAFAQLTWRESLRDIEACLRAQSSKLYHLGFRSAIARNTLANANAVRDWRIYADFAQHLIGIARRLYANDLLALELDETVYALDSTTIDLCLSVFPWAPFRSTKAAVKLHTLLDLRGSIPSFIFISDGKMHDVNILDQLVPEAGAFYVMDRGYLERLAHLDDAGSFFVTRAKSNLKARRRYSRPVDRSTGLICDQTVLLTGFYSRQGFDRPLRRIKLNDPQTGKRLVFLTNNFALDALTIAKLYKYRWQVELFFKWIKQHLRIKAFFGTSENAVKSQIWIAVSVYVLVAIVKKRLALPATLYEILQILSLTLFEKTPVDSLFDDDASQKIPPADANQLNLFN
jgi:Domain of unknown function (DUF4372)/Transposase DDE domain